MAVKKLVEFVENDTGYQKVMRGLTSFTDMDVIFGFIEDKNEERQKGDPLTNATLGYIHEYGSPAAHIPKRPFLQPAFERKREWAIKQVRGAILDALSGNRQALKNTLTIVGTGFRDQAKANIREQYKMKPLSEETLEMRRRRGLERTKALIDTGQLLNAIHFRVLNA